MMQFIDRFPGTAVPVQPIDLSRLKVFPLAERRSLTRADDILIDPESPPLAAAEPIAGQIRA